MHSIYWKAVCTTNNSTFLFYIHITFKSLSVVHTMCEWQRDCIKYCRYSARLDAAHRPLIERVLSTALISIPAVNEATNYHRERRLLLFSRWTSYPCTLATRYCGLTIFLYSLCPPPPLLCTLLFHKLVSLINVQEACNSYFCSHAGRWR